MIHLCITPTYTVLTEHSNHTNPHCSAHSIHTVCTLSKHSVSLSLLLYTACPQLSPTHFLSSTSPTHFLSPTHYFVLLVLNFLSFTSCPQLCAPTSCIKPCSQLPSCADLNSTLLYTAAHPTWRCPFRDTSPSEKRSRMRV